MTLRWHDPGWRDETLGWARDQLIRIGRIAGDGITQPHVVPWSTVFRIPTDDGTFWCKASGPATAYEGRLLEAFARHGIRGALLPIATDPDRGLILLPDGGPTLRATRPDGTGDHDLAAWSRVLDGYAELQRASVPIVDELVAGGVPDLRSDALIDALRGRLADDGLWARADPEERDAADAARRRLPVLLPEVADLVGVLAGSGVAATIQHDDLHGGNILVGPEGDRIFDWGDAVVMHPFTTMTTTMNSISHHAGLDQHGPELRRLRAGYIEHWTDVAPRPVLEDAVTAAMVLGAIARSAAWDRVLHDIDPADVSAAWAGAPAGWLIELVDRLDRARASAAAG